jgi:carbamoyl-phosphate synthase large subunit
MAARGLAASLVGQVLVEESVLGWEELELEVVRDAKNQMITVCFIENVMPWACTPAIPSARRPC